MKTLKDSTLFGINANIVASIAICWRVWLFVWRICSRYFFYLNSMQH